MVANYCTVRIIYYSNVIFVDFGDLSGFYFMRITTTVYMKNYYLLLRKILYKKINNQLTLLYIN